jgi:CHAT domain-containing protein/tetratricopeptide (TPR) repeat protein
MQDGFQKRVFNRLAQLPTAARRIRFISRLHLLSPVTVKDLDEAVRNLVRTDLNKAGALAEASLDIANTLGDKESVAFASRAKANALWFLGQHSAASAMNAHAVQLFREVGQPLEEGRTLSTSIQPLILLGEYDRAQAAGDRAREIFLEAGETVRLARLDINIANIFHRQDRFTEALECYQRAYSQLAPDKDSEGIIVALHNMAVCLTALNENEKAQEAYEQVRKFCEEWDMPLALAQAEYNIAYLYFLKGEYGRAIEMLREAYSTSVQGGDVYHAALCRLDLSEIYLQLNVNQESAELAEDAYQRFEQLGMGYEAAKALCQWALALGQQRKNFRALMLFAQARSMFVAEKNRMWPALIDLYVAFTHFNDGRYIDARRYCASALAFFHNSISPGRAILCHLLLAKLSLKAGDMANARLECQGALNGLTGHETPVLIYQAHLVMGQIEEAGGRLHEAENRYRAAKEILEGLRSGIRGEELRISFLENRLEVYEKLVGLCLAQALTAENMKQAWTYMEQAKSRNLLESMVRGDDFIVRREHGPGVALNIVKLREQLNWYYHRIEIEQMTGLPGVNELVLHLRMLAEQNEKELLGLLRELPPDEAEAAGLDAKSASIESVREALGPDATLVEYFRIQERILATVITPGGMEMVYVTTISRVADILSMLQQQFSQFHLSPKHIDQFIGPLCAATRERLRELYVELISPIRESLRGKHLVIVPHEVLHTVPFHALFDDTCYLIDSFTLSYAPSASIFVQCQKRRPNQTGISLVMGMPTEHMPAIEDEIKSVARLIPNPKLFSGPEASEMALRENAPDSRFIHIATHGFFRQDQPMFSGVRLGDTFLTLYDLYNLKLSASHVTLSGCSTGVSTITSGDEVMGLTRGLLFAGARSLLLTLWEVNDSSTTEFMKYFYTSIIENQNPALAIQRAMQELKKRYPHPYYWAPFSLVGGIAT